MPVRRFTAPLEFLGAHTMRHVMMVSGVEILYCWATPLAGHEDAYNPDAVQNVDPPSYDIRTDSFSGASINQQRLALVSCMWHLIYV